MRLPAATMHFAVHRKSSDPPPFLPRASRLPALRRSRLKIVALAGLAFFALFYLLLRPSSKSQPAPARHVPSGHPRAVIVTVFDETNYGRQYLETVRENRRLYAEKHGYEVFFPKIGDYDLNGSPFSWTKIIAMRHALTKFPDAQYFWFIDQDAFVMDPAVTVEGDLMKASRVEEVMIKDYPVVPPDSIIKTFAHLKGEDVDFTVTQDKVGLSIGSFILRNGDWARFFLETWFDPIYRSYNFQKAETHALEHIVQWHPTILSKLALMPQRTLNAYGKGSHGEKYEKGDPIVRFDGCTKAGTTSCEKEAEPFIQEWREAFGAS